MRTLGGVIRVDAADADLQIQAPLVGECSHLAQLPSIQAGTQVEDRLEENAVEALVMCELQRANSSTTLGLGDVVAFHSDAHRYSRSRRRFGLALTIVWISSGVKSTSRKALMRTRIPSTGAGFTRNP